MESLHFLNNIFDKLLGGKSTGPGGFPFFLYFPIDIFDIALIPGANLDGHRGTWTGCIDF